MRGQRLGGVPNGRQNRSTGRPYSSSLVRPSPKHRRTSRTCLDSVSLSIPYQSKTGRYSRDTQYRQWLVLLEFLKAISIVGQIANNLWLFILNSTFFFEVLILVLAFISALPFGI